MTDSIETTSFIFYITAKNAPPTLTITNTLYKVYDIQNPPQNELINLNDYFLKYDSDIDTNAADSVGKFLFDQTLPNWLSFP